MERYISKILTTEMDFKKHCIYEFGEYVKFKGDSVMTNNMTPRTHEEIALGPVLNLQGTHKHIPSQKKYSTKSTHTYGRTHARSSDR